MYQICDIENEKCVLEVYECEKCGCHIGVDFTYTYQVDELEIICPVCKNTDTTH